MHLHAAPNGPQQLYGYIGSQKAGTTWLYDALTKHQSFIASMRRPGCASFFQSGVYHRLNDTYVAFT